MHRAQPKRPKRKAASKAPQRKAPSRHSAQSGANQQPTDDTDDLNIVYDEFMPEWNYTIFPRTKK
jgi:hypothetical protein